MMHMLRFLIPTVILIALCVTKADAQQFDEDLHLEQAHLTTASSGVEGAPDLIRRSTLTGDERTLFDHPLLESILQNGNLSLVTQNGESNSASVLQYGRANLAAVAQDGLRNQTDLEQIGERNIFGAWLTGDDNTLSLRQHGNDNVYVLDFVGNDLNHSVDQIGSGIRAVQIGHGSRPFSVEQRGSGMEIRIEHNSH